MQPRRKVRILIVEDAAFLRAMLRGIVEGAGFEVVGEACDADEAVARFRELAPDVVFMDLVMPGRSGIDAVREIRRLHPAATVIVCSMLGQEALVRRALRAGARETILKPYQPEAVRAALRSSVHPRSEASRSRVFGTSIARSSEPSVRPPDATPRT